MDATTREARIGAAFVAVADTLTKDFDVVDLLHTLVESCTSILDVDAGGLMLADPQGELQLVASTSEGADLVEIMQLDAARGPCIECFTTGIAISVANIEASGRRWPEFQAEALRMGYLSVHATPMRLRGQVIGTMNLFGTRTVELSARDAAVAQALADVATIGILQDRVLRESHLLAEQLHRALDSRVLIEQAKGVIAQSTSASMDEAFAVLRNYSRNHNVTLRSVAESITTRTLEVSALTAVAEARRTPAAPKHSTRS
jgi:GAF domain-containing protein